MALRPHSPTEYPDITSISLNRLLDRLEQQVLSADANPRLRRDGFERKKVSSNVEHARTLLLNLEHTLSTSSRATLKPAQKSQLQADLQQKRHLIKQLNQRLYELEQLDDGEDEDGGSVDEEEDEDLFPSYAPRVKGEAGLESGGGGGEGGDGSGNEALRNAARGLASELRSRKPRTNSGPQDNQSKTTDPTPTATTTSSSLFPNHDPTTHSAATTAHHNATEQEALTSSLLAMAQQLKSQSLSFNTSLETDKSALSRAVDGLDKGSQGMEAASQRMGVLRRMTEGKGWWGRMKLYALIFGLWVVAFLIVFVGPKVRF